MNQHCTMHCGRFFGVDSDAVEAALPFLKERFMVVEWDDGAQELSVCAARRIPHDPEAMIGVFDRLAGVLGEAGQGSILVNCGALEVCYFRQGMWKLVAAPLPEDPFEGIRQVPVS